MATDHLIAYHGNYGKKTSWAKRRSEEVAEKTRLSLQTELSTFTAQCATLQSQSGMDSLFQEYSALTSREFTVSARPRPARYKFFRPDEFNGLEKEQTSAYRAAKLSNTTEAQAEYAQKACFVKRLVAREERNAFRSFCDELENPQLAQSQAIIKRIAEGKKKYVIHHQPQGRTLNLLEYTLSLNEESRPATSITWSVGTFVPAVDLQNQIETAIMSMPSKRPLYRTWSLRKQ